MQIELPDSVRQVDASTIQKNAEASSIRKNLDALRNNAEVLPINDDLVDLSAKKQEQQTLFIKKVAIKDFLTYRECSYLVENELSPSCNLILGKNGSGKSSLLRAIIYVLSDSSMNLSK